MPTDPFQLTATLLEIFLLLAGVLLVFSLLFSPAQRTRWFQTNALRVWPIAVPEFILLLASVMLGGIVAQGGAQFLLHDLIGKATEHDGLGIIFYSCANYLGACGGWLLFPLLRKGLYADYGVAPDPLPTAPNANLSVLRVFQYGAGTLLISLPVLTALMLGWTFLLRKIGLPDEPQSLLGIFSGARSNWVIAGMLLVACVLAPCFEELVFRAGLYRFCRQRLGRGWGLVISGFCFSALHGNWSGLLPLAVLGMIFALVYEATGSIAVVIVAHSLFNLNTVVLLLAGLNNSPP